MAKLIITEDGREKIHEIAEDRFTIGSGPEADLRLRSEDVAPLHVEVQKSPAGYRIVDLESKDGTYVNGAPVNQHVLGNGDTIQLGDVKITYIGKGPARAGGASASGRRGAGKRQKKTNLKTTSRSHYRRESWDSGMSSGMRAVLIVGLVVIVAGLLWFIAATGGADTDDLGIEIKNAIDRVEKQPGPETFAAVQKTVDDLRNRWSQLSAEQRELFQRLEKTLVDKQATLMAVERGRDSKQELVKIRNQKVRAPNDHAGRVALCEAFLKEFGESAEAAEAREILAEAKAALASVTPEQRELAELEKKVAEMVWSRQKEEREFRRAYELVGDAPAALRALYQEELDAMATKLRKYSMAAFQIRKNEARHALREGKMEEARRQVREMLDKLVTENFTAYLEFPDGGYGPAVQKFEDQVQVVLREELARFQGK